LARRISVEIVGDASSLQRSLQGAQRETSSFQKGLHTASKGAVVALAGLGVAAKAGFDEFSQGQKVAAQTNAVLKSTGGVANVSAGQVNTLATSLMKKSGTDDEAIASGENLLLTFTKVRNETGKGNKIFDQATRTMLDMSTALGQDTKQSAKQLGKALQDPIKGVGALRRVGVSFTEAQKDQIKTLVDSGNQMGAQKVILKELNTEFGGSAEAAGKTFGGQVKIAKEELSNFAGELVGSAMPALETLFGILSNVTKAMEEHKTVTKIVVGVVGGLAIAVLAVNAAMKVWRVATMLMTAAQWLLNAALDANPIGLIVIALAALAIGFYEAWKHSETFRKIVTAAMDGVMVAVNAVVDGFKAVVAWVRDHWREIVPFISGPFAPLVFLATDAFGIRSKLVNAFKAITTFVADRVKEIAGFITGLPGRIGDFAGALADRFKNVFNAAQIGAWIIGRIQEFGAYIASIPSRIANFAGGLADRFKNFFNSAQIGAWISDRISDFANFFGDMPGRVGKAVAGKAKALWEAIKGIFDRLPKFIRDALGIASPSKEFEAIGVAIMEGAIKGIKGLEDRLVDAAKAAFDKAFGAVKEGVAVVVGAGADESEKVSAMVATAAAIDKKHYPYAWGGGHNSSFAPSRATDGAGTFGYDCSGAVSAVLHAAGLISSPMVSGDLAGWGSTGFGKFITIFADAVHTFMVIMKQGFGTGGDNPGGGAGWLPYNTPYRSGFATRHPPGLAAGGIVTRPTYALVGERGPEAVVPLSRYGGAATVNVYVQGSVTSERDLAMTVRDHLKRYEARNGAIF
jgi:phage-related protein